MIASGATTRGKTRAENGQTARRRRAITGPVNEDTEPHLDRGACYRALASRDARFDGRFFVAVRTTGIYCRPVCRVRLPRLENVEFFVCAAAAERGGFRACRRCRPESAPGSSAWLGTEATVARALRGAYSTFSAQHKGSAPPIMIPLRKRRITKCS